MKDFIICYHIYDKSGVKKIIADGFLTCDALTRESLGDFRAEALKDQPKGSSINITFIHQIEQEKKVQTENRYFFDQDSSSHWYMVPESIRDVWTKWRDLDPDLEEAWEAPKGAIQLDGFPGTISFENPSNLSA
jgi:hypothetical protein